MQRVKELGHDYESNQRGGGFLRILCEVFGLLIPLDEERIPRLGEDFGEGKTELGFLDLGTE